MTLQFILLVVALLGMTGMIPAWPRNGIPGDPQRVEERTGLHHRGVGVNPRA